MRAIQWYFRRVTLVTGAFWFLGALGAPAAANPVTTPDGPAKTIELAPVLVVSDRDRRVVLDLVDERKRVTSYDNTSQGMEGKYPQAIFGDAPAGLRYILFENIALIAGLGSDHRQMLLDKFEGSEWIVGVKGSGRDLKSVMGLLDPALEETDASTDGSGLAVFLYRSPQGLLNELVIAAPDRAYPPGNPDDPGSLAAAFQLMRNWHTRREAFVGDDSDDPWNAIQNIEYSGYTTGVYNGNTQTVGTYKLTLSPYWLDSDQNGDDWYRIDFQTYSEITNYEYTGHSFGDTSGKCGWWTTKMHADITVLTLGGQWWDFMPDTTVGSTSTGFSIGGNVTTSQAGITGSYSKSYGTSDVTIEVLANAVDQSIDWKASLSGCGGYSDYPYYHGASSAAKTTYNLDPSLIIAVPAGEAMVIETGAEGQSWDLTVEKDHVKCDSVCAEIHTHEYKSSIEHGVILTCTKMGCG